MLFLRSSLAAVLAALVLAPVAAWAVKAPATDPTTSHQLWATVNACNPADSPGAVGLRGSMPGDGDATQHMFMRLQVQFQGPRGGWKPFAGPVGDSGFLAMGSAKQKRHEAGQTFQVAQQGQAFVLRGVATYQWRAADGSVVLQARRVTTLGHVSSAGSDPAGFTAATCAI